MAHGVKNEVAHRRAVGGRAERIGRREAGGREEMFARREADGSAALDGGHGVPPWRIREMVVSPAARLPVGRQVEVQLARAVLEGRVPPGSALPSTRRLAHRLSVHRNTVAAAYRRLAQRGLVHVRRGARVIVSGVSSPRPVGREPPGSSRRPASGVAVVLARGGSRELAESELRAALPGYDVAGFRSTDELVGSRRSGGWVVLTERAQLADVRRAVTASASPSSAAAQSSAASPSSAAAQSSASDLSSASGTAPVFHAEPLALTHATLRDVRLAIRRSRALDGIMVVSVAPELRRDVRETAAALRGGEIPVLTPDPTDLVAVYTGMRAASFCWIDRVAAKELRAARSREDEVIRRFFGECSRSIRTLRLVSRRTVRELRAMLRSGVQARRTHVES